MARRLVSRDEEALIRELKQDVQQAFANVQSNDQFWCRTLVRSIFSYLEAHSFVIRTATRKLLRPNARRIDSVMKLALLSEPNYLPDGTGKLKEGAERRIPFVNHFAFTLRTYAEAGGMKAEDIARFFGDNAFNQLRKAKQVRDRLTHPKCAADIVVTASDLLEMTNAFNFVSQFILDIELQLTKRLRRSAKRKNQRPTRRGVST